METPKPNPALHHRIHEGLARVAAALRTDDWSRAKCTGLNPTQLSILDLLEGREGGLGVKDIALHLGVSQPTATDSIAALERKGYVAKRPIGSDRRAVNVCLTAEGRSILDSSDSEDGAAEQAIGALSGPEQADLLLALVKMIRHLQEQNAIPIQRMCVSCRYFAPFAHGDAARPHHCNFVDAPFGQPDIRIDCRDHETASPAFRAATWDAFQQGK